MKTIFCHPTGNANVRAAAVGLAEAGILSKFYTTIGIFPEGFLDRLKVLGPLNEFQRRRYETILKPHTILWPWRELGRFSAVKTGLKWLIRHEKGIFCIDAVYKSLDKRVASKLKNIQSVDSSVIYAYEDGALHSFREAKKLGLKCYYELPIGYWRTGQRILKIEREKKPDWSETLGGLQDSKEKLDKKDEELSLADRIFVASSFTAESLKEFPGTLAKIEIIPYGFPDVAEGRKYESLVDRPLKILFVGGLSQRKGIADLFQAVDSIGTSVKLTVVGKKPNKSCETLDKALAQHQWIASLPHKEILKLMQSSDVLVFPSLFEGFGLVITEAMSQGTPVITTDRTAGPDLIEHEKNGWIIEAGSSQAIQEAIEKLLENPELIESVGKAAMEKAKSRPWSVYSEELVAAMQRPD